MKKEPLTTIEIEVLKTKIKEERTQLLSQAALQVSVWLIFLFWRDVVTGFSQYQGYQFLQPIVFVIVLVVGYHYYKYKKMVNRLKNDLDSGEKIVDNKTIWKKEKQLKKHYSIWLNSDIEHFQQFDIREEDYNKVEKGHIVTLEYAEKSKVLYKIDLNI